MPVYEDVGSDNEFRACYESRESELFEEFKRLDHVTQNAEGPTEAEKIVLDKATWRLRISKREVYMFRIRRAGELAMSTTVGSLGICAAAQSLSEGGVEGVAIGVMGILWSLGVGREVIKDLNSPEHMDLVHNLALERMYHGAAMVFQEVRPEL